MELSGKRHKKEKSKEKTSKKCQPKKSKKSYKKYSSSSDSSSDSDSSSSSSDGERYKKIYKKHKKKSHYKKKKCKKMKYVEKVVENKEVSNNAVKSVLSEKEVGPSISEARKCMAPMTKEEWEKQQSVIRRVFDPETGRNRLVKGDGEILEEIVSKKRHKEINKMASFVLENEEKGFESDGMKILLEQVYSTHVRKIKDLEVNLKEAREKLSLLEAREGDKFECNQCKEKQKLFDLYKQEYFIGLREQAKKIKALERKLVALENKGSRVSENDVPKDVLKENKGDGHYEEMQVVLNEGVVSPKEVLKESVGFGNSPNSVSLTEYCSKSKADIPTSITVPDEIAKCDMLSISSPDKTPYLTTSDKGGFFSSLQNSFVEHSMDSSDIVLVAETCDADEDLNINYDFLMKSSNMMSPSSQKNHTKCLDPCSKAFQKVNICNKENHKENGHLHRPAKHPTKYDNANLNVKQGNNIKKKKMKSNVKSPSSVVCNSQASKNVSIPTTDVSQCNSNTVVPITDKSNAVCDAKTSMKSEHFSDFPVNSSFFEIDDDLMLSKSTSLLKNDKKILQVRTLPDVDDKDDFQITFGKKKESSESGSWKSCKKPFRRNVNLKPIKCTSKFKIALEAPGVNFKKPKYKQTKLSKSIFVSKSQVGIDQETEITNDMQQDSVDEENETLLKKNSRCKKKEGKLNDSIKNKVLEIVVHSFKETLPKHSLSLDLDRTCIPEDYQCYSLNESIEEDPIDNSLLQSGSIQSTSLLDSSDSGNQGVCENIAVKRRNRSRKCLKIGRNGVDSEQELAKELNSFDRLPVESLPNYKFKEESVRNQNKRRLLQGYECKECEKYYMELGLSDEEKGKRLKHCSRHRATYVPPSTPEHFWELEFPSTQVCKDRGYLEETQKVALKPRRRRPL